MANLGMPDISIHIGSGIILDAVLPRCPPILFKIYGQAKYDLAAYQQVLQRTKIGSLISAPLLAIALGLLLAAFGIIPIECPDYELVSTYLLPMAAALYLLESDVRE